MNTGAPICGNCGNEYHPVRTRRCWVCDVALPLPAGVPPVAVGGPPVSEGQKTIHPLVKIMVTLSILWGVWVVIFVITLLCFLILTVLLVITCFGSLPRM